MHAARIHHPGNENQTHLRESVIQIRMRYVTPHEILTASNWLLCLSTALLLFVVILDGVAFKFSTILHISGSREMKAYVLTGREHVQSHLEKNISHRKRDENYGRAVLHRHNSHDALDRKTNEREEPKATISRYRSDDTLDRQSWFPPPPPGYTTTPNTGASRREPTVHPPIPPKPSSAVSSPNQLKQNNSEELDNLIKMNKSLNRNQGLDGLFRANLKSELTEKRAKSLENLMFVNTRTDKDGKGKQDLDGLIKVNPETNKNIKRGQSLDNLIQVTPEVNRSNPSSQNLDNLIKVNPRTGKSVQGDQSLDNVIKVTPETNKTNQGSQDLDSLIKVTPSAKKNSEQGLDELINVSPKAVKNTARNQDLDKLIKVNPEILLNNQRNQDLDNLIKVNPAVIRSNQSQALDNLIQVKPAALRNTKRDQNLENLIDINYNVSKNKNERQDGQVTGSTENLISPSSRTAAYAYEARKTLSKSPKDGYQETVSGKYIQTVYSTSDRSVIERDMCTYCRKPLGTETKMILDELQICCHSTCFKCEICKQPLENLQAGDSIWIYRQTIHCESCYSKVVANYVMIGIFFLDTSAYISEYQLELRAPKLNNFQSLGINCVSYTLHACVSGSNILPFQRCHNPGKFSTIVFSSTGELSDTVFMN
ncbi:hypothetical protein MJG53_009954 [Ovis ammon polii x Ovis aries]|uniref:Uncharacterized protein n=1 Tax=Ovis ammon polii x Ovis aries TaxID=2918886 RepID=A0ACB9UWC2_9CETA|nr:hypothetical protein MJG53_009954 [Ovis ammon polii x Ovis aries]